MHVPLTPPPPFASILAHLCPTLPPLTAQSTIEDYNHNLNIIVLQTVTRAICTWQKLVEFAASLLGKNEIRLIFHIGIFHGNMYQLASVRLMQLGHLLWCATTRKGENYGNCFVVFESCHN